MKLMTISSIKFTKLVLTIFVLTTPIATQALEGHWHRPSNAKMFHENWAGWENPSILKKLEGNSLTVVKVNRCSGVLISENAHVLTNQGCILKDIADSSDFRSNYLKNGVRAASLADAPIIETHIEQTIRTNDVSAEVTKGVDELEPEKRASRLRSNIQRLESSCQSEGQFVCEVRAVAEGLEYQMTLSRVFKIAAVRYTAGVEGLFEDDNPTFLQGKAPKKPAFAVLQLFKTRAGTDKIEPLKINHFAKLARSKVKVEDPVYSLGFSNIYKRYIPEYWVKVNLDLENNTLDDYHDFAEIKQRHLKKLAFSSERNLIDLYAELGSVNNWLWRLKSGRSGSERKKEQKVFLSEMKKAAELEAFVQRNSKEDYKYFKNKFDQLDKYDRESGVRLLFDHLKRIQIYQDYANPSANLMNTEKKKNANLLDAVNLMSWIELADKRKIFKKNKEIAPFIAKVKTADYPYFVSIIEEYYGTAQKIPEILKLLKSIKNLVGNSAVAPHSASVSTWPIIQKWKREYLISKDLPYYPSINKKNILGMTLGTVKKIGFSDELSSSFASDLDLGFRNSKGAPTFDATGMLIGMYYTTDHVQSLYLNHYYDETIAASFHFSSLDILSTLRQYSDLKPLLTEIGYRD